MEPEILLSILEHAKRHYSETNWSNHIDPPYCWRPFLILSSPLYWTIQYGILPSDFATKSVHAFHFFSIPATCPVHLLLLDLIVPVTRR